MLEKFASKKRVKDFLKTNRLHYILNMDSKDLQFHGFNKKEADSISSAIALVREAQTEYSVGESFTSSKIVSEYILPRCQSRTERFWVLLLDIRLHPIAIHEIASGSVAEVSLDPLEIFRPAIIASSKRIILIHNHPSGSSDPSDTDIELTSRMVKAGETLGITVIDHFIVTSNGQWTSLADKGYV